MSGASLPIEVIELIVDKVAECKKKRNEALKALSLTCKALTPRSQGFLWEDVDLYFDDDKSGEVHRRTMLRVRRIAFRAQRFGGYVRSLTLHTLSLKHLPRKDDLVAKAIENMPNLTDLDLIYGSEYASGNDWIAFERYPETWKDALIDVLAGARLQTLRVWGVRSLPALPMIKAFTQLKGVNLKGCAFSWTSPMHVAGDPAELLTKGPYPLQSPLVGLTCDGLTYGSLLELLVCSLGSRRPVISFPNLKSLELSIGAKELPPEANRHEVLRQASALEWLDIRDLLRSQTDHAPIQTILCGLNPGSYTTLIYIDLDLHHECITDPGLEPYMGLCSDVFPRLESLQSLALIVNFSGPLGSNIEWEGNMLDPMWGLAWGRLDHLFRSGFRELYVVRVGVKIRPFRSRSKGASVKNRAAVGNIQDFLVKEVYRKQFQGLFKREEEDRSFEFEFTVQTVHSTGVELKGSREESSIVGVE